MGRPKNFAPAPIESEDESQEAPDEERAGTPVAAQLPRRAVSQSDAARIALDAGYRKPGVAVEYIKDTFGIDMNPQYFSAIKSRMKASQGLAGSKWVPGKRGRRPKVAAFAVEGHVAPRPEKPSNGGQPDLIESLEALKPLVASMGAARVKRLVDLLG